MKQINEKDGEWPTSRKREKSKNEKGEVWALYSAKEKVLKRSWRGVKKGVCR